jgi:abelson tyrosine-protein kinase 1
VNVLERAAPVESQPPWFSVSLYFQNGSLVTYLKDDEVLDLLRCMHQFAKGMEYLHRKGVL